MTESEKKRDARLRREFNITLEQCNKVLKHQGGVCAVCKEPPKAGRSLCVDHCHLSGKVRGLLCFPCNKFVVGNHVDSNKLKSAAYYLDNFPVTLALGFEVITAVGKIGTKKRAKLLVKLKGKDASSV